MPELSTTRLSTRGQVVIPEEIRTRLRLKPGVQFIVLGDGDSIVLKRISPPSVEEFQQMLDSASGQARRAGLKKSDVAQVIKEVRKSKKARRQK